MTTPSMPASIETARISGDNTDAARALLETVVPPRPSLRQAFAVEGTDRSEGFVVTEAGRAVLAVAATAVDGDPPITWIRIASALPRRTRRWLEALPLAASALCRSPDPVECTIADWANANTRDGRAPGAAAPAHGVTIARREPYGGRHAHQRVGRRSPCS
jgi:hypothetical protein